MAVRPDDAAVLAKSIREMFTESEAILLEKLANALAEGLDKPDWAERKLLNIRRLLQSVDAILLDLQHGVPGAVEEAIAVAYNRGSAAAGGDLVKVGMSLGAFSEIQPTGAVAAIASEVTDRITPMSFQIRRAITDIYQQVITQVTVQVSAGVLTRREAAARALTKLAIHGITGFVDKSGRKWEMGAYAEQSVRTGSMNAALQGHVDRVYDLGVDTMIVSDAPEECKVCRPYEGQVLSVSGNTTGRLSDGKTVVASLNEAKRAGLFHNNCRHSLSIYLPGVTKTPKDTEDPKGDALRQQQRAYERRIRELKRETALSQGLDPDGPGTKQAKSALRAKQSEFTEWREANDRKNLSYRTNIKSR